MFSTLASKVPNDRDYPERTWRLEVLRRVVDGTLYDVLRHPFGVEYSSSGEYIPLRERRPSVRYNLCRTVVGDSVSMLFGDGRFPAIDCEYPDLRQSVADLIADAQLPAVMLDAAHRGSVGSVAVLMRVLRNRLFFDVMDTGFLTPVYDPEAPDTLLSVTERYKVTGKALRALDYDIADDDLDVAFWFQRVWDTESETRFVPWKVVEPRGKVTTPQPDKKRSVKHGLGFVPLVWIKNLPGGDDIDGACTFRAAVETQIEIDYQLSQAGRGLKYSSEPTLLIKEPAGSSDGDMVRSASNALVVDKDGDAKLLEINGTASAAVIEYVRTLRELALEQIQGNRSNADKVSAAQSGRALEMLHQPLVWLAGKLRTTYGEIALKQLLAMIVAVGSKMPLMVRGKMLPLFPADAVLSLKWGPWFAPTEHDKSEIASTLTALRDGGLMSRRAGVKILAPFYDHEDVDAELAEIAADEAAVDARAAAQAAQVKATETLPD